MNERTLLERLQRCDSISIDPLFKEAADEIERLTAELADANNSFGSQTANWPGLAGRIEDLKRRSNERWRDNERLQARVEALEGEKKWLRENVDKWPELAKRYADELLAATEQGESDG